MDFLRFRYRTICVPFILVINIFSWSRTLDLIFVQRILS